jgi:hypothetical protein
MILIILHSLFINKYHYSMFVIFFICLDFPRPRSHIPINPIQYEVRPTRIHRTRRFQGGFTVLSTEMDIN